MIFVSLDVQTGGLQMFFECEKGATQQTQDDKWLFLKIEKKEALDPSLVSAPYLCHFLSVLIDSKFDVCAN